MTPFPRPANVTRADLFNKRVRKIVVPGRSTFRQPPLAGSDDSRSSYTLQYTITLRRRG